LEVENKVKNTEEYPRDGKNDCENGNDFQLQTGKICKASVLN
jgi:hypothetical protein